MSDIQAENDSESSLPTFRPFTREELAIIENRISEKRAAAIKRAERRARNIAVSKLLLIIKYLLYQKAMYIVLIFSKKYVNQNTVYSY